MGTQPCFCGRSRHQKTTDESKRYPPISAGVSDCTVGGWHSRWCALFAFGARGRGPVLWTSNDSTVCLTMELRTRRIVLSGTCRRIPVCMGRTTRQTLRPSSPFRLGLHPARFFASARRFSHFAADRESIPVSAKLLARSWQRGAACTGT